jgi:hypothetical protein
MQLCEGPPWPGNAVIVVDAQSATRSHIVSPRVRSYTFRNKFTTLNRDSPDDSRTGVNIRAFPALQQD